MFRWGSAAALGVDAYLSLNGLSSNCSAPQLLSYVRFALRKYRCSP